MDDSEPETGEATYPLRTVARLTGLSPELLRAWERRYGVIEPARTPGGTRRYSAADIERLRLVKRAVDAGHRVGRVAHLDMDELKRRAADPEAGSTDHLDSILKAVGELDGPQTQRLLAMQLSVLGSSRFAREVVVPLVREIGDRWANRKIGIASEHLATGVLRSLLGAALHPTSTSLRGPRIVFATPTGEHHELGLLMATLTALDAGAHPLYLGCELPVDDLLDATANAGAAAVAMSIVTLPRARAVDFVNGLRERLPGGVHLWLGGAGASDLELPHGVEYIPTLEDFERRVMLETAAAKP